MMNWLKTWDSLLRLLVAGLFFVLVLSGPQASAITAAMPVQAQVNIVSAEARVEPATQASLAFQSGGVVAEVLVEQGEAVASGTILLRLDSAAAALALEQAEARQAAAAGGLVAAENQHALAVTAVQTAIARHALAQANLDLVRAGPRQQEIAAAENEVAAAAAVVSQAIGNRDAVLAIADDSEILAAQAAVAEAQALVQQLEQTYDQILNSCVDTIQGEVCPLLGPVEEQTREQLAAARLNQAAAQAALDGLQNGPTPAQRQAANAAVNVAQANLAVAQAALGAVSVGATSEQIRLAEVAVEQAEIFVQKAEIAVIRADAVVVQAEAAVLLTEAGVEAAALALARSSLHAPFDGVVVSLGLRAGELVGPGLPVVTLANFSEWQLATTDLTELDVALVADGARVEVNIDALPEAELAGQVTAVGLVPQQDRGEVVYPVTIALEDTRNLPLRWGMTAFVDIETN